jgi:hypothetical protein
MQVLTIFLTSTARQARQYNAGAMGTNATLQRIMHMLGVEGMNVLGEELSNELNEAKTNLSRDMQNAAVCELGRRAGCSLR